MQSVAPVLYAEDDENDTFLMERAFRRLKVEPPLRLVNDGKQAIAYLMGTGAYSDRQANPLPCLVLLDLSMPGKTGLEVLQWVRTQPFLSAIPVIVLTSSNQQSDIHRAGLLGASAYLIKPGEPDELLRLVREVNDYWILGKNPPSTFTEVGAVRKVNGNGNGPSLSQ
jgi:CheY-like chemotaxis protein